MQYADIGHPVDYIAVMNRSTTLAACFIGLMIPATAIVYFIDGSLLKVPFYLYSGTYFVLSLGAVTAYTMGIRFRLVSLSSILKEKLNEKRDSKAKAIKILQDDASHFRSLAMAYQVLMDVCDDTNLCYGFQLMIGSALSFFYSLFTGFSVYVDLAGHGSLSPVTWSSVGFALYYNFFLTTVILTCSLASSEVDMLLKIRMN